MSPHSLTDELDELSHTIVANWPRLTRFYGLQPETLAQLPNWLTRYYVEELSKLEAEEMLAGMIVTDFPHYDKRSRDRLHRRFMDIAGVKEEATVNIGTAQGRQTVAGLGLGVKFTSMKDESA